MTQPRTTRRTLRTAVGAAAVVLLAGGTTLAVEPFVARAVAEGVAQEQTTSITQQTQQDRQPQAYGGFPGSGPLYRGPGRQSTTGETASQAATSTQVRGLVRIETEIDYGQGAAAGTGMVVTSGGTVITNHHVVAGATAIRATDESTGQSYTARVVGTDPTADVAVLRLEDASGLTTVKTDTGRLSVGDKVTAVGDAGGTDDLSAASGTVSGLDRSITTQAEGSAAGERLTGLIEMDADVISGDSGGATYDSDGEVVGMTTAASTGSADVTGYAIPIARVLEIAEDLTSGVSDADYDYGYPAFLGVALGDATTTATTVAGVYDDSAADRAGLEAGDTVDSVDGTPVTTSGQLRRLIAAHSPGDRVTVTWTDESGESDEGTATLGEGPVA